MIFTFLQGCGILVQGFKQINLNGSIFETCQTR